MSSGPSCNCEERNKPLAQRAWHVVDFRCNHSAFNGGHHTASDYSSVRCDKCRSHWRTKATYVNSLPMIDRDKWLRGELQCVGAVRDNALPFTPNQTTVTAMAEAQHGGLKSFTSVDDLMTDLITIKKDSP